MINIDVSNLNNLEKEIHSTMKDILSSNEKISISECATLCNVSASKISKYVNKLGFHNFKQYKRFLSGSLVNEIKSHGSSELQRISEYIRTFDYTIVDNFIKIFDSYDKIILFGYGPSYICVEFFAYRLRIYSTKFILTFNEEVTVENLAQEDTLVIIFSTTGAFRTFDSFFDNIEARGGKIVLVLEEYNTSIDFDRQTTFFLTNSFQNQALQPFEKSRTVFFIFMEEVVRQIVKNNGINLNYNNI